MKNNYKVSILIPIYNIEQYIERCARSLFEQTYQDIEYIFVDDCSPDNSIELLENVIKKFPQRGKSVRILKHTKNRGLAAARNTAVDNCETEFLMHVDSDDYIAHDAVEKLVRKQQETGADIVTGQAVRLFKYGKDMMERPYLYNHDDFVEDMIKPSYHHTIWGRLIRKSLYTDNNIQAKEGVNIGEDLQVMSQLAYYASKEKPLWDVVYYYDCTNENSYINQYQASLFRLRQDTESMEVVRDFFENKEPRFFNFAEKQLMNYYLRLLDFYCEKGDGQNYDSTQKKFFSLKQENRLMSRIRYFKIRLYFIYRIRKLIGKVL